MFAPIVVNHLMVTIVKIADIQKCSIDMSRLVIVQFEGNPKEYAFLTYLNALKTGDKVMDKRYDKPFVIKSVGFNCPNPVTYKGHVLKWLTEETILWVTAEYSKPKENMEKRNITVSLEEARNWYNGKDQTLRKLALQAYTEEELSKPQNFKEVLEVLGIEGLNLNMKVRGKEASSTIQVKEMSQEISGELTLHMKLRVIAKYFNGIKMLYLNEEEE